MQKRKVTIEVDIDDERVKCIEDLEREILAQNIHKQVAINTKSKRRSGGRPSIKGILGINLESGEKYVLFLGFL
jgi:hypothetical protein